jgi:IclR family KDG regulon transcriptional repressor
MVQPGADMPPERETSIRRGLEVLLALGTDEALARDGLGVVAISEQLGREKSQVSRTLKLLSEYGLVDRNPDTLAYRLGWRIYALSHLAGERRLIDEAGPLLARLVAETSEPAHLSVLQGANALTLRSENTVRSVQAVDWVGRGLPVYCSTAGRALLLDAGLEDLKRLIGDMRFEPLAPNTVRDVEDFAARIAVDRERGYVVAHEELEAGLTAVAVPVRDVQGRIIAALNVGGPTFRFAEHTEDAARYLLAAAADLSAALGAPASPAVHA